MKKILFACVAVTIMGSAAEAKGGKFIQAPTAYDYSREKAAGYKKDYCLDSVGNHVYCPNYRMSEAESWTSWH